MTLLRFDEINILYFILFLIYLVHWPNPLLATSQKERKREVAVMAVLVDGEWAEHIPATAKIA